MFRGSGRFSEETTQTLDAGRARVSRNCASSTCYERAAVRSALNSWPPPAELGPQLARRPLTARPTEMGTHQKVKATM